jgi:hypothetical protein
MVCMRAPRMPSFDQRHTGDPRTFWVHGEVQHNVEKPLRRTGLGSSFHLRSAREWIFRLAGCPRVGRWCRLPPVRASCRPDIHSCRPPVSPEVCAPPAALGAWGPMSVQTVASRRRAPKTTGTRPLSGTGWRHDICPTTNVKNKIRTSTNYFSENRKTDRPIRNTGHDGSSVAGGRPGRRRCTSSDPVQRSRIVDQYPAIR